MRMSVVKAEEKHRATEGGRGGGQCQTHAQGSRIHFLTLKPKGTDRICPVHSFQDLEAHTAEPRKWLEGRVSFGLTRPTVLSPRPIFYPWVTVPTYT